VGSPAAVANATIDALKPYGVRHAAGTVQCVVCHEGQSRPHRPFRYPEER
jgi:hypothetical protein